MTVCSSKPQIRNQSFNPFLRLSDLDNPNIQEDSKKPWDRKTIFKVSYVYLMLKKQIVLLVALTYNFKVL